MSAREHKLEEAGYHFTGEYSSDVCEGKQRMKEAAAAWRARGYLAQVVTKTYAGRVTSSVGHSVYIKLKKPMTPEAFVNYKDRFLARLEEVGGSQSYAGSVNKDFFLTQLQLIEKAVNGNKAVLVSRLLQGISRSLSLHPVA